MKKLFLVCVGLYLSLPQLSAQDVVPEIINHLYFVADSNKLESLEKTVVNMKSKSKLAGFGGATSSYVIDGPGSTVQIASQQPSFAIKLTNTMMDPSQMIQLYRFEKKDKSRESVISKVGGLGSSSSTNTGGISYHIKQNAKGTYLIIPEEPLKPGEYGFVNMMSTGGGSGRSGMPSYTVFAFSVR